MRIRFVRQAIGVVRSLVADEEGQDLIEYALLTGLITVGFATVFSAVQGRMADAYQNWISGTQSIWVPPPPS